MLQFKSNELNTFVFNYGTNILNDLMDKTILKVANRLNVKAKDHKYFILEITTLGKGKTKNKTISITYLSYVDFKHDWDMLVQYRK